MKKYMKRTKLLFALVPLIAIIFYMLTANVGLYAEQTYTPMDVNTSIVSTKPKPLTGTPLEYSAIDNFSFAADVLNSARFFRSETTGEVIANIGIKYVQEVQNSRVVKGKDIFTSAKSLSSMKKVAEQKYFSGSTILYRGASGFSGSNVNWSDKVTQMGKEVFGARYGVIPREITKYVFNESTVKSAELIAQSDNLVTFRYIMDEVTAPEYSKKEMRTMGGAKSDPTFSSCIMEVTMTKDWQVQKIVSLDTYRIDIPGLGGMNCTGELTEVFYDIDSESGIMPPEAEIFQNFVPSGEDDEEITQPKSPADYLAEAFAPYMSGEEINLTADIDFFNKHIDLDASINIATNSFKFNASNLAFIAIEDGKLYFDINNNKGYVTMENVTKLLKEFSGDFDINDIFGGDILTTLFENARIIESETQVHIIMPVELMDIKIDIDMGLKKAADGAVSIGKIVAKIDLSKFFPTTLKVDVNFADSVSMPSLDSFPSFDGIFDFVGPIKNTINATSFDIAASGNIKLKNLNESFFLTTQITKGEKLKVSANLNAFSQNLKLDYDGEALYAALQNIKLYVNTSEISQLIENLLSSFNVSMPKIDFDIQKIIEELNFEELIKMLTLLKVEGNTLSLGLSTSIGNINISLSQDGNCISNLNLKLEGQETSLNLSAGLKISNEELKFPSIDKSEYTNLNDLARFIDPIKNLINAKTLGMDIYANILSKDFSANLSGNVLLSLDKFALSGNFNTFGINARVVYENDCVYLSLGSFKIKLKISDIATFKAALEDIITLPQISGDIDISNALDMILSSISSLSVKDNTLCLMASVGGVSINLSLSQEGGNISNFQALLNIEDINISLNANLTKISTASTTITAADKDSYLDAAKLAQFIKPVYSLLSAQSIAVDGNLNVASQAITARGFINLADLSAKLAVKAMGQNIDVSFKDSAVYLSLGEIRLKLALQDIESVLGDLSSLLPGINNGNVSINPENIFDILSTITIQDNNLKIKIGEISAVVSILENGVSLKIESGDFNADFTLSPDSSNVVEINGEYVRVRDVTPFIAPIMELVNAKSYSIDIYGAISSPFKTGAFSGNIIINRGDTLDIHAALNIFEHRVNLYFVDNQIYIAINDIKLTLKLSDIDMLMEKISEYIELPSDVALPKIELDSLIKAVQYLGFNDGELRAALVLEGIDLSVSTRLSGGKLTGVTIENLAIGDFSISSDVNLRAYADQTKIEVYESETYANLSDLVGFIDPVFNTVKEEFFTIDFGGSVKASDKTTSISGNLAITPNQEINFMGIALPNIKMNINLDDGIKTHSITLSAIYNSAAKDFDAFITYNTLNVQISLNNLLRIVGSVKDILRLNIPLLDDIISDVYVPLDTSIFDGLNIAGLNEIRDAINSLFEVADDAIGSGSDFDQILKKLSYETISTALLGISIEIREGTLLINMNNNMFNPDNSGIATISINHNGNTLRDVSITNLVANGNSISFNASLRHDPISLAPPQNADAFIDLNNLNGFLTDVIRTANLSELDISGKVDLSIGSLSLANISVNLKVKVEKTIETVDGVSTATYNPIVYGRLGVPMFLGQLSMADSYIYYVDNTIYIKRDSFNDLKRWSGKQFIKATPAEFMQRPLDYLFYLIPLKGIAKSEIDKAIAEPTTDSEVAYEKALKDFNYKNGSYGLALDIGKLAGNSQLGVMNLNFGTTDFTEKQKTYKVVNKLDLSLNLVKVLNLNLNVGLNNIGKPVGNVSYGYDKITYNFWGTPTGYFPYRPDSDISDMKDILNSFSWGTFDNPVSP